MHNIEWGYYHYLAEHEPNLLKRLYFRSESRKLRRYERHVFKHAQTILPISHSDTNYFSKFHKHVSHLPPFHGFEQVIMEKGTGRHVLVHGDFRIRDNASAAIEVALASSAAGMPCVVAGKSPPKQMYKILGHLENIEVLPDVSAEVMLELKKNAQMHVVHSDNPSGFKIKLLNALFSARHVLVQATIVEGEHLDGVTHAFRDKTELRALIRRLKDVPVTDADVMQRETVLLPRFSNRQNAGNLINLIFQ